MTYISCVTGILIGYNAVTWGVVFYGIMIMGSFHQCVYYNLDRLGCINTYLKTAFYIIDIK